MFPQIPEWIGRIFPTYYILKPVVEISQLGGGWPDIAANVGILIAWNIVLLALAMLVLRKKPQYAT